MENLRFALYDKGDLHHYETSLTLLSDYFDETCADKPEDNIPKKYLPKILETIGDDTKKYAIWLYLCMKAQVPIGFAMAQIDTAENPLCKREGWGFIREFYISPPHRRKGYAKNMCAFIENVLYENGAQDIYLTANAKTGVPFWAAMGYVFSGAVDEKNGNKIYEKRRVV